MNNLGRQLTPILKAGGKTEIRLLIAKLAKDFKVKPKKVEKHMSLEPEQVYLLSKDVSEMLEEYKKDKRTFTCLKYVLNTIASGYELKISCPLDKEEFKALRTFLKKSRLVKPKPRTFTLGKEETRIVRKIRRYVSNGLNDSDIKILNKKYNTRNKTVYRNNLDLTGIVDVLESDIIEWSETTEFGIDAVQIIIMEIAEHKKSPIILKELNYTEAQTFDNLVKRMY